MYKMVGSEKLISYRDFPIDCVDPDRIEQVFKIKTDPPKSKSSHKKQSKKKNKKNKKTKPQASSSQNQNVKKQSAPIRKNVSTDESQNFRNQ